MSSASPSFTKFLVLHCRRSVQGRVPLSAPVMAACDEDTFKGTKNPLALFSSKNINSPFDHPHHTTSPRPASPRSTTPTMPHQSPSASVKLNDQYIVPFVLSVVSLLGSSVVLLTFASAKRLNISAATGPAHDSV